MATGTILKDWMLDYKADNQNTETDEKTEAAIIEKALAILKGRLRKPLTEPLCSPQPVLDFLRLKMAALDYEVFSALYLDGQNRVMAYQELYQGTLDTVTVHPREVVRECFKHNAAGIIFANNHPSGIVKPSEGNQRTINHLQKVMTVIEVRVLDFFIIGGMDSCSFAEQGLL